MPSDPTPPPRRLLSGRLVLGLLALMALAIGGVGYLTAASGGDDAAARPRLASVATPAPVEDDAPLADLKRKPRAVDPEAGVPVGTDEPEPDPASEESDAGLESEGTPKAERAPSDAEIRRELAAFDAPVSSSGSVASGPGGARATLGRNGLATAPVEAPAEVKAIIEAGNKIAKLPYRYGGGHGSFQDNAYDCSGSVSYALAGAGLVKAPMASSAFMNAGANGPGRWVTIYANPGHMYMEVAGLRFDTSGAGPNGSRWQNGARSNAGFAVRHPPRL